MIASQTEKTLIVMIASQTVDSGDKHPGKMRVMKPWFNIFKIEVTKVKNIFVTRCPSDKTQTPHSDVF